MKKGLILLLAICMLSATACGYRSYAKLIKKPLSVDDALIMRNNIEQNSNPVARDVETSDMQRQFIEVKNVMVHDIIRSTNVEYEYCLITSVTTKDGDLECYVYTNDTWKLAKLIPGKSRLNIIGDYGRFFNTIESNKPRLEILHAEIKIIEEKN